MSRATPKGPATHWAPGRISADAYGRERRERKMRDARSPRSKAAKRAAAEFAFKVKPRPEA